MSGIMRVRQPIFDLIDGCADSTSFCWLMRGVSTGVRPASALLCPEMANHQSSWLARSSIVLGRGRPSRIHPHPLSADRRPSAAPPDHTRGIVIRVAESTFDQNRDLLKRLVESHRMASSH